MKKLLISCLGLLVIAGCSGESKPAEKKTVCTLEETGVKANMTLVSKENKVNKIDIEMRMDGKQLGIDEMTDEQKDLTRDMLETEVLSQLPEDDGLKVKMDIDGTDFVMVFNVDYEKIDEETLKSLNMNTEDLEKDLGEKELKDALEDAGWSCK